MSKISNQTTYSSVTPQGVDYVIGTDVSDLDSTKTFEFSNIASYVKTTFDLAVTNVLSGFSTSNQEPSGLDIALQVEFGAAQNTGSDPVMLAADGTITFNQTGLYLINGFANFERQGSSGGVSVTAWRALLDGSQIGVTKAVDLSGTGIMFPYELTVPITIETAGTVLTYEVMRDSSGVDAGGLYIHTILGGWSNVPSASIDIFKVGI
ncbi:MAG: hypothetical protein CBB97_13510 [Candidatus Endolissoclinum sp. TMED37]|nr:MAG: hypothetical protein CBB97_13510 [Candidatus Endolissoclinum sp. TMED37]|tara:strand:- start:11904 stop:12527 length:624 start_codon:yes stop_codon:yes gene_type:complete